MPKQFPLFVTSQAPAGLSWVNSNIPAVAVPSCGNERRQLALLARTLVTPDAFDGVASAAARTHSLVGGSVDWVSTR